MSSQQQVFGVVFFVIIIGLESKIVCSPTVGSVFIYRI